MKQDANEDGQQDAKDAGNGRDGAPDDGTGGTSGQQDPTSSPSPSPRSPGSAPPDDSWIAVLASEPVANGAAARDDRLANVRAEVPEAELLRSDDYSSLSPGYWVIHAPGPFADGKEAIAFCADRGRTAINACYGDISARIRMTAGSGVTPRMAEADGAAGNRGVSVNYEMVELSVLDAQQHRLYLGAGVDEGWAFGKSGIANGYLAAGKSGELHTGTLRVAVPALLPGGAVKISGRNAVVCVGHSASPRWLPMSTVGDHSCVGG